MRNEQWRQTNHPVIPLVTPEMALIWGAKHGVLPREMYVRLVRQRELAIRNERENPYEAQAEPTWWNLIRALFGRPLRETMELEDARKRTGLDNDGIAAGLRRACGFGKRVTTILLLGGNRTAKTTLEMRLLAETVRENSNTTSWAFHSNFKQSRKHHMKPMWYYLPQDVRTSDPKTKKAYVAWKEYTGFSDEGFMLQNGSEVSFKTYEGDMTRTIEGGNIDYAAADEMIPSDWVEALELRAAERNGNVLVGFTPVQGYSSTVQLFLTGAVTQRSETAWLLPMDGGAPDVARQLGLTADEYDVYRTWLDDPKKAPYPTCFSRWWDVYSWIGSEPTVGAVEIQRQQVEGRTFCRVPIVARCAGLEGSRAVVWIHSHNNPWGNPLSVWKRMEDKSREWKLQRFYGFAMKGLSRKFAGFDRKVHVLPHDSVVRMVKDAKENKGCMFLVIDPASARNWALGWFFATETGLYWVEEWPSQVRPVAGLGPLGEWVVTDGKLHDGRPGPAQKSLGWGVKRYFEEATAISAELEKAGFPPVWRTIIDARFAATPTNGQLGPRTLLDECWDLGWKVEPSSTSAAIDGRSAIDEGEGMIASALDFDREKEVGFGNRPRFFLSDRCANGVFCLENHTGLEGLRSATKDFVDLPRMCMLSGCTFTAHREVRCVGGGHY